MLYPNNKFSSNEFLTDVFKELGLWMRQDKLSKQEVYDVGINFTIIALYVISHPEVYRFYKDEKIGYSELEQLANDWMQSEFDNKCLICE